MREHFERAVENVVAHGDTDIFPFPFERHLFIDKKADVVTLLQRIHSNFDGRFPKFEAALASMPPAHERLLTSVGYTGFRWATHLDPLWNLYFLGLVISIGGTIESARIPIAHNRVFSYRYIDDRNSVDLFRRDIGWIQFMQHSIDKSLSCEYVVLCDIADFYQHADQHRLQNALSQLHLSSDIPARIMVFLENFSKNRSYGLPIGGPAARLLSELLLDQVDRLLAMIGMASCRFADDYHIFCASLEEAYRFLLFLSEKLLVNQGLSLQKSKTRVMTSAEFRSSAPVVVALATEDDAGENGESEAPAGWEMGQVSEARAFMRLSLRYDPYSATADQDYELLKAELSRFDILGMLNRELAKSKIDVALTRKLASAIRHLGNVQKNDAILSIMDNLDLLYPIFPNVMIMVRDVLLELDERTQDRVCRAIIELIRNRSHLVSLDVHLAYAIRALVLRQMPEAIDILMQQYETRTSNLVRRDIILVMATWGQWYWVSDLRNRFDVMTKAERRAFIVASYALGDEGKHWRENTKGQFDELEVLIRDWAAERKNRGDWETPI
jgi:Reverse transcriptase (RNA-dependent DNA polymerase)